MVIQKWRMVACVAGIFLLAGRVMGQTKPAAGDLVPAGTQFSIALGASTQQKMLFAAGGGAFVKINSDVYGLAEGKKVGSIPEKWNGDMVPQSLSADGKFLAAVENGQRNITIVDIAKGAAARTIAVPEKSITPPQGVAFAGANVLWMGNTNGLMDNRLIAFDALTGKQRGELKLNGSVMRFDVSGDGKWAGLQIGDEIQLIDLTKMAIKSKVNYPNTQVWNFRLSHDGAELAILSSVAEGDKVTIYDATGKMAYSAACPSGARYTKSIQFLPGKTGIFAANYLIDRRIGKVTWIVEGFESVTVPVTVLNAGQVMAFGRDKNGLVLKTLDIPHDLLELFVAAYKAPAADALLKPGMGFRVEVDVKKVVMGTTDEVKQRFEKAIERQLGRFEYKVDAKATGVIRVTYSERADDESTKVVEKGGTKVWNVVQTLTNSSIEVIASDGKTALHRFNANWNGARSGSNTSSNTTEAFREQALARTISDIAAFRLPTLIQDDLEMPERTPVVEPSK